VCWGNGGGGEKTHHVELASAGRKVDDQEIKEYILDLDDHCTPLVASINAIPSTTLIDMCSQLTAFDQRQVLPLISVRCCREWSKFDVFSVLGQ
jgi:hypothetical protein